MSQLLRSFNSIKALISHNQICRCLSNSSALNNEGWLSKLLHVRKIDPGKDSHSRLLSDSEIVYEMQIHNVRPDSVDPYSKSYETWIQAVQHKIPSTELIGSWRCEIGDQDQFIHIWRFNNGYKSASSLIDFVNKDPELQQLHKDRMEYLRSRQNQYILAFSYWGHPDIVTAPTRGMYELRSYILKPGTMIEWGNNWARAIHYRKSNAVAGFFSQIGQLYTVHHLWAYQDLQMRKEIREAAWRKPGWDECVAYTVPLIREMRSRWLYPTSFSPLK